jgi:hypothetical protein
MLIPSFRGFVQKTPSTVLPTRSSFPPLEPEDIPAESGDEVILTPDLLERLAVCDSNRLLGI